MSTLPSHRSQEDEAVPKGSFFLQPPSFAKTAPGTSKKALSVAEQG